MDQQDCDSQIKRKRLFILAYLFSEEVILCEKEEKTLLQIFKYPRYFINTLHTSTLAERHFQPQD